MADTPPAQSIDMRGKTITTFVLYHAVVALRDMNEGETLEIAADDYEPIENDINAWCRTTGHTLVGADTVPGRGFLKQEEVPLEGFLATGSGALFDGEGR